MIENVMMKLNSLVKVTKRGAVPSVFLGSGSVMVILIVLMVQMKMQQSYIALRNLHVRQISSHATMEDV